MNAASSTMVLRWWWQIALVAALLPRRLSADPACLVAAEPDTELDSMLDVRCDGDCNCSFSEEAQKAPPEGTDTGFAALADVLEWIHEDKLLEVSDFDCWSSVEPGSYALSSRPDGHDFRCVAVIDVPFKKVEPLVQSCPAGFYCLGGLYPPLSCSRGNHCPSGTAERRDCPAGFFCPMPGGPKMECPDGSKCLANRAMPSPCKPGHYCPKGDKQLTCPAGHWCAVCTGDTPVKCGPLTLCPEGSKAQTPVLAFLFLAVAVSIPPAVAKFYGMLVNDFRLVFAACLVFIVFISVEGFFAGDAGIVEGIILAFLFVSLNWLMVRFGVDHRVRPEVLLCVTVCLSMVVLGAVHRPWALLVLGLALLALIFSMMSRQEWGYMVVGRGLLLLFFLALCIGYLLVDPRFATGCICFLLAIVLLLAMSWLLERRRLMRRGSALILPKFPQRRTSQLREAGSSDLREAAGVSFRLDGVSFHLPDGSQLMKDVSLRIDSGRQVAVMGTSGGGKSTLLAVLSGRASYGRVSGGLLVCGREADDLRFLMDVTGFVPQDDILHGELTVQENIQYQGALRMPAGASPEQVEAQAMQVMKDLGLAAIAGSRVGSVDCRGVSGGQRKRVSIAMELVASPLLLFADEPTSGLDSFTSHEVVGSLAKVAREQGTTTVAVIHQPRYETLELFDDLVLLGVGGFLVYAGPTKDAVGYFEDQLKVIVPSNVNPADKMVDAIQADPEACAETWREYARSLPEPPQEEPAPKGMFYVERPAFFQTALVFLDRSMLLSVRAVRSILVDQAVCAFMVVTLCSTLKYDYFDRYEHQAAFTSVFLMMLHCVAIQRVFGVDLLVTSREAQVGAPMVAYFLAKDLAAMYEVTLTALTFTATYGLYSGTHISLAQLFVGSWGFLYCVSGTGYILSVLLSPGTAQMCGVGITILNFCVAGTYQPKLHDLAKLMNGRGWMLPAMNPVRWFFGFLLTAEGKFLTPSAREMFKDHLNEMGYNLDHLDMCDDRAPSQSRSSQGDDILSFQQLWLDRRGWVCSSAPMLMLGLMIRFLAVLCLLLHVDHHTTGWARFFAQSSQGVWQLVGRLFALVVGMFLALFLFAEVWVFGLLELGLPGNLGDFDDLQQLLAGHDNDAVASFLASPAPAWTAPHA